MGEGEGRRVRGGRERECVCRGEVRLSQGSVIFDV